MIHDTFLSTDASVSQASVKSIKILKQPLRARLSCLSYDISQSADIELSRVHVHSRLGRYKDKAFVQLF